MATVLFVGYRLAFYDTLSEEQLSELKTWYQAWLNGTNTQTIPEKPEWLT